MKEELFQELLQSVREIKAIRSGKAKPSRTFTFDTATSEAVLKAAAWHPRLSLEMVKIK